MHIYNPKPEEKGLFKGINQLVMDTAKWFAALPGDAAVHCLLERLGELHQCDRVFIVQSDPDFRDARFTHEWCGAGISPTAGRRIKPTEGAYKWMSKKLRQGKELHFSQCDVPRRLREVYLRMTAIGVQSVFAVPLFVGKNVAGALGYHKVWDAKKWASTVRKETWIVSEIIGAWLGGKISAPVVPKLAAERMEPSIFVKADEGMLAIPVSKVMSVEAALAYTRIHVAGAKPIIKYGSIVAWEKKLPAFHFLRVHRSHIVNPSKVVKLDRNAGAWRITLADGRMLPVGRMYREKLMKNLEAQAHMP